MSRLAADNAVSTVGDQAERRALARASALGGLVLGGLAVAVPRLVALDVYSGHYDEGVWSESVLLLARGHWPYREVFNPQGPLFLVGLLPAYLLGGGTQAALRAGVAVYALVGALGIWLLSRRLAPGAAVPAALALLLLAASPGHLRNSRLVLAEVPAVSLATLAVALAAWYWARPRPALLVVASLALAASLAVKPLTLAAALPVALLVALPWRRQPARALFTLAFAGGLTLAAALLCALPFGLDLVLAQSVRFHAEARAAQGWDLAENLRTAADALSGEGVGLYALAAMGLLQGWRRERALAGVLGLWALAATVLLLPYAPLYPRHFLALLPPLLVLAAAGLGWTVAEAGMVISARRPPGLLSLAGCAAILLWLLGLPAVLGADQATLSWVEAASKGRELAVANRLAALTRPDEVILTDQQSMAFWAARAVPVELADTFYGRISSGAINSAMAIAAAERERPRLVLLWNGRLGGLKRFRAWVEANYDLLEDFGNGKALYARRERP